MIDTRPSQPTMADAAPSSGLLTVAEAARQITCCRKTITNWITKGRLPAVRIAGRHWVRREDLRAVQEAVDLGGVLPDWRRHPGHAGIRLRRLREAAGLTQQEFAAASGVEHETISRLETGQKTPAAETIRKLAAVLAIARTVFVDHIPIAPVGMTTDAAAARLEVPRTRVQRWLRSGTLAGGKVSGQWRVPVEAVLDPERRERFRGRSRRLDPRCQG